MDTKTISEIIKCDIIAVAMKKFTANPEIINPSLWTNGTADCRTVCHENDFIGVLTSSGASEIVALCHWAVFYNWAKTTRPLVDSISIDTDTCSITLSRVKVRAIGSNHLAVVMQCKVTTKLKEKEA